MNCKCSYELMPTYLNSMALWVILCVYVLYYTIRRSKLLMLSRVLHRIVSARRRGNFSQDNIFKSLLKLCVHDVHSVIQVKA